MSENNIDQAVEPKEHEYEESGEEQYIAHFQEQLLSEEGAVPSSELIETLKGHPQSTLINLRDILLDVANEAVSDKERLRYTKVVEAIGHMLNGPQNL